MLSKLKGFFTTKTPEAAVVTAQSPSSLDKELAQWKEQAFNETSNTPDAMVLDQYAWVPVIIVDEKMRELPKHEMLGPDAKYVGKVFTDQETFILWKKKLGKETFFIPLRTHNNSLACRIRGELYFVPPSQIYKLDRLYHNKVFFKRKKIEISLPYSARIKKVTGSGEFLTQMSFGHALDLQAYIYIGVADFWDNQLDGGFLFGKCERFFPKKTTEGNYVPAPYYAATIRDFTVNRFEQQLSNSSIPPAVPDMPKQ